MVPPLFLVHLPVQQDALLIEWPMGLMTIKCGGYFLPVQIMKFKKLCLGMFMRTIMAGTVWQGIRNLIFAVGLGFGG
jgi:hypothetical protein